MRQFREAKKANKSTVQRKGTAHINDQRLTSVQAKNIQNVIQRYIYTEDNPLKPIENYEQLPRHIISRIDRMADSEEKDEIQMVINAAIADPDVPVRLGPNSSIDDLRVQLYFSVPDAGKVSRRFKAGDIVIGTKWAQKAVYHQLRSELKDPKTPIFLDEILEELKIPQGTIEVKDKPPSKLTPTDCFGIWLKDNMPPLPSDALELDLFRWMRLARRKAMFYFTRIAREHSLIHFLTERMDESLLMREGIEDTSHLEPAYYDLLELHDQYYAYKGLRPHSEEAIDLSKLFMYKFGEQIYFPWAHDPALWRLRQDYPHSSQRIASPAELSSKLYEREPKFEGAVELPKKKYIMDSAEEFDKLTTEELHASSYVSASFDGIIPYSHFLHRLKMENRPCFEMRRRLVPELTFIEARLQEYAFAKADIEATEQKLKAFDEMSYSDREKEVEKIEKVWRVDKQATYRCFELLYHMEHDIYAWHSRCPIMSMRFLPLYHKSLLLLLNTIHKEHIKLTKHLLERNHASWIPDIEELGDEQRDEFLATWRVVSDPIHELGHFSIDESMSVSPMKFQTVDDFRPLIISSISRLMTKPYGRKLICSIINLRSPSVSVSPGSKFKEDSDSAHAVSFREKTAKGKEEFSKENPFSDIETSGKSGGGIEILVPSNDLAVEQGRMWKIVKDPRFVEPADGSSATPMAKKEKTTDFLERKGYYLPRSGNFILNPTFVTFGHESGHVHNYHSGSLRTKVHRENYKSDPELCQWSNNEEHFVIEEVENKIRDEHGLPQRQWHTTFTLDMEEVITDTNPYLKYKNILR